MWLRVNAEARTARKIMSRRLRQAGIEAVAEPRVPQAVLLSAPRDVERSAGVCRRGGVGAGSRRAMRRLSPGSRARPAGARRLRGARRQDGAHGRARARPRAADRRRHRRQAPRSACARTSARGRLEAELVHGDAAAPRGWWDGVPFDRILLDAPCSALGVIRRHPDIRLRRSPQDLAKMPAAQMRLLDRRLRHARARGPPGVCDLHAHTARERRS